MTYVPGYRHDFFVSYAHVDNDPMPSATRGWVDDFVKILTTGAGLAGELGRRDAFSFYWDNQSLRINHEFNDRIPEEVKQSALFLAILSPGYAASDFCRKELNTFVQNVGGTNERLFVVQMKPLEDIHKVPPHLLGRSGCKFFEYDKNNKPQTLGWPLPHHERPEDRTYYQKIGDLKVDMTRKLMELKNDQPISRGPAVLLTEVTDFLDPHRDKVRRYLDQLGFQILPADRTYYGLARSEYEKTFLEDLAKSAAVVQLLGPELGKRPDAAPLGFPYLQYELAKRSPRRADGRERPILQWRDPERDLKGDEPEEYRRLLESVEAMPLSDFEEKIVRVIRQPEKPNGGVKAPTSSLIYVNCAAVDKESADEIGKCLEGFHWKRPYYDKKPKSGQLRETIENDLLTCDVLFLVYGKTGPKWVRRQLELYWDQVASRRREKGEPSVRAVVNAGENPKQPIGMGLPGWQMIGIKDIPDILKGVATTAIGP